MATVSITSGAHRARVEARRNALVEANLELVRVIARAILASLPPSFELDDLIAAGNLGLLQAATRYRPKQHNGTPFSAYARPVIRGAILDSIKRANWREATHDPIDAAPERAVVVNIEDYLDRRRQLQRVATAVSELEERLGSVLDWRYNEELAFSDVGERLGVGRARASQLHGQALAEVRELVGV